MNQHIDFEKILKETIDEFNQKYNNNSDEGVSGLVKTIAKISVEISTSALLKYHQELLKDLD